MLGIGLAFVLVFTKVIYLSLVPILIVILAAIVVGILWGQFAPAKPPKDPEPVRVEQTPAPESSRFDDFTDRDDSTTDGDTDTVRSSVQADQSQPPPEESVGGQDDPLPPPTTP
jgi:hypothetical protein